MLSFVDLFCGCGGMSLGFIQAGFKHLAAFDAWDKAVEVYKRNVSPDVFVADVTAEDFVEKIKILNPDVIVGGPPCQDFSSAAGNRKNYTGAKAVLSIKYAEIIAETKPRFFLMENVPPIQKSPFFKEILAIFKNAGYGLTYKNQTFAYCGVPQLRRRMIMIGVLGGEDNDVVPYWEPFLSKKMTTVDEYTGGSWGFDKYFLYPVWLGRQCVYSTSQPCITVTSIFENRPGDKFRCRPQDVNEYKTAPKLNWRHAADVQTFPSNFSFDVPNLTKRDRILMIANAVPPAAAKFFGETILRRAQKPDMKTKLF